MAWNTEARNIVKAPAQHALAPNASRKVRPPVIDTRYSIACTELVSDSSLFSGERLPVAAATAGSDRADSSARGPAGSTCVSESRNSRNSPVAKRAPWLQAALLPERAGWVMTTSTSPSRRAWAMAAGVPSREPSSTTMISNEGRSQARALRIVSMMWAASSRTGITMLTRAGGGAVVALWRPRSASNASASVENR